MTRQYCHQHDSTTRHGQATSVAPSSAWLDRTIASMTRHLYHVATKSPRQHHRQHDWAAPLLAWLGKDITQRFDHQHKKYITSIASRHVANSYWYYSPLCLVLGPMQASCCAACTSMKHLPFQDSRSKTPELNSLKDLIREPGATPNRCTYAVPPFWSTWQKTLSNFIPEYLVPELSTRQIHHGQGRSRSPSTYSLAKHSGVVDEDWYPGTTLYWLRRPKEGRAMTWPTIQKIPEGHDMLPKV
jgi:hypothetical protein